MSAEDTGIVVTIIDDTDDGQRLKNIAEMINGEMAPMNQVESCADITAIKKVNSRYSPIFRYRYPRA